ncbi:MAG TPA: glycosyltransferase family 39 protein [Candidatus Acidoferrales bacterium]
MKEKIKKIATNLPVIVAVSLLARLIFAVDQARKMPANLVGLVPFLNETGNIAFSLAQGHGFSSPWWQETGPTAWLTPVYPWIVSVVYQLFGIHTPHAFYAVVLVNILFSAAACVPIYLIGKKVAGSEVAVGAAWLWALFPNAILIPYEWVWDTSLSALLMATIVWATLQLAESSRRRDWLLYGALWGCALMTNPALGSTLPILLGWAAYRRMRDVNLSATRPLVALGIAILCCVPWTVRNYIAFHKFVPLRSNFPLELWLGNNDNFDEDSQIVPPSDPTREEIRRYIRMGETAFMAEKWRTATTFVRTHPRLEAILWARRFVATWTGAERPVESFGDAESNLVRVVLTVNSLVAVGAIAGIVALIWRRSAYAFPLAAIPLIYPVVYYATHTSLRYRHPIDPVLLILVAIGLANLLTQRPDTSNRNI